MPLITKRQQIALKVEASEGAAEALTATEAILVGNVAFEPTVTMTERPVASASLSPFGSVAGGQQGKLTFDAELKGSGTAGTAPEIGPALLACGMAATTDPGVSVIYKPASASIGSYTLGFYVDGKRYLMAGARGTFKLDIKAGEPGKLSFEFLGTAITDASTALLVPTYNAAVAPPLLSGALAIDSYAAIVESVGIDMANELYLRPSANTAHGYVSTVITGRKPKLTMNAEDVLVATKDFWTLWKASTYVAFTMKADGGAGNICTITAPKAQILSMKPGDRSGIMANEIECGLARNAGDDELSLAFT